MVFKDFFQRIGEKRSFQRQIKAKQKVEELESRAFRFEREAELKTDIGKKKERIRKAKKKIFEQSPAFTAIAGFKQVGRGLSKTGKAARGLNLSGFGVAQEDVFMGGTQQSRRKKKRSRQETEEDLFGDLGTDRFF